MADQFPDEGLDLILSYVPMANPTNTFIGLYTAVGGTSIPPTTYTLANLASGNYNGYGEVSTTQWTTYTRQTHAAGSWGARTASTIWGTTGRAVQGSQVAFAAPTGSAYSPTNPLAGFFVANALTGGSAFYFSNFSDGSTIASLQVGDVVKVQPGFGFGN